MMATIEPLPTCAPAITDRLKELNIKKKPKTKDLVKRSQFLDQLYHTKNVPHSLYYFTSGRKLDPKKMPSTEVEHTPFWFPPDTEEFSYKIVHKVWQDRFREEQASYKYNTRPTFRSRQTIDLLERLHVPEATNDSSFAPGILDLDPEFFSIVGGRKRGSQSTITEYKLTVQETLKTRLKTGYLMDEVLKIDENFVDEQNKIDALKAELSEYCFAFEDYLAKDHKQSMEMLKKSEKNFKISQQKQEAFKNLDHEVGRLKSRIYILEEKWRNRKIYQRFLYEVSPLEWRMEFDYIHRQDGRRSLSLDLQYKSIYGKYRLSEFGSVLSLDNLIEMFTLDTLGEEPPLLYFKDPKELLEIFQYMEKQNLNSLLHVEDAALPLEELLQWLVESRGKLKDEFSFIEDRIQDLKRKIDYEESRAQALEELSKDLIYKLFKNLVNNEDAINLFVDVEDAYEYCVAPNDSDLEIIEMMEKIEHAFELLMLELDYLPPKIVSRAEKHIYEENARVMLVAIDADKKLKLMEQLMIGLKRTLEPPFVKFGKELKPRSDLPSVKKKEVLPPPPLSEYEMDMLRYFTDYCHHSDDVQSYLPLDFD